MFVCVCLVQNGKKDTDFSIMYIKLKMKILWPNLPEKEREQEDKRELR